MFNNLTALAMGIVVFAITIGVGTVVLTKFGNSVGGEANTTVSALNSDLGTGGLAGWTGAIIALAVGLLFIAALSGGRRKY